MRQVKGANKFRRPGILEQLESRQLLSTTFDNGVVAIVGTPNNDLVSVVAISGRIDVNDNGTVYSFAPSSIQKVTFDGGSGGDKFEMQRDLAIPVEAWGGIGRDTLVGGAAADTLWGGKGGDLLIGNNGGDQLRGALGDDRISGGGKVDVIYGGEGNDTINTGAGDDVVNDEIGTNVVDTGDAGTEIPFSSVTYKSEAFLSTVTGYDPNQIRRAYDYGEYNPNAGAGQTIYIVNAFTGRDVLGDFQKFCAQFDLPLPVLGGNFEIVNASGRTPAVDPGWAGEINLDVQWAHAAAPGAKIVLVQADSDLVRDITQAIRVAASMSEANGGGIVSMSLGSRFDDFIAPGALDREAIFQSSPKTTFIAASGDVGGIRSYPATSPFVTAVGGTTLPLDQEGTRNAEETAWIDGGGGITGNFRTPAYQSQLGLPGRGVPDVSYNADPATGFAVYLSTPQAGDKGWFSVGGTSAGAPQWAGIVARINQVRNAAGQPKVGANLNGYLYEIYNNGYAYNDGSFEPNVIKGGFNDIILGSAGVNPAAPGYDLATGIGSPDVSVLLAQMTSTTTVDNFYFTSKFEFDADFFLPIDEILPTDTAPLLDLSFPQHRQGYGVISGSDTVVLEFTTVPNKFQDPAGEAAGDLYDVELHRTRDGRIYGQGAALVNNVNNVGPFTVTFALEFEGSWSVDANGQTHVNIDFYAIDPSTGAKIEKSVFQRSVFTSPYAGCWFGGTIES